MFTYGINSKVCSIVDLSVEQKERLIESIKNYKDPEGETDHLDIIKVLLPRLESSKDKNGSFDVTVVEQTFMLTAASSSDEQDLYKYISFNTQF